MPSIGKKVPILLKRRGRTLWDGMGQNDFFTVLGGRCVRSEVFMKIIFILLKFILNLIEIGVKVYHKTFFQIKSLMQTPSTKIPLDYEEKLPPLKKDTPVYRFYTFCPLSHVSLR